MVVITHYGDVTQGCVLESVINRGTERYKRSIQEVYWYRGIKVQRLHWSLVQRGTRRVVITYQGGVAERQQELLLEI